jgi:hypothetical protein
MFEIILFTYEIVNIDLVCENLIAQLGTRHKQQTPWPLVRKRTTPTKRPPLVDEIYCQLLWIEVSRGQRGESPMVVNLSFLDRTNEAHCFEKLAESIGVRFRIWIPLYQAIYRGISIDWKI